MDLLEKVKIALQITGDFHDESLKLLIAEVKQYMLDAGVVQEVVDADNSVGVIIRGVADMFGTAQDDYSTIFKNRVTQLAFRGGESGVS